MKTETTHNLYVSRDQLVSISIITPKHWPRHDYKCVAVRVKPKPHERVRQLDDQQIEIVFTKEELRALIMGFQKWDPDFGVVFTRPMVNKPEERKEKWRKVNQQRISQQRFYRRYRSGHRS